MCKMNKGFFIPSGGCHGNKENSILAVTIATNQENINWYIYFMHFAMLNNH